MGTNELSRSAQRVQQALQDLGLELKVVELPESTRTAADAAQAIGCQIGQIAKSLIFKTEQGDHPILVIASGDNRVDLTRVGTTIGEDLVMADAAFVREVTGFVIGGVPPVGHRTPIETYIDEDMFNYDEIWAAAGTPRAVFQLTPDDLLRATSGHVIRVA